MTIKIEKRPEVLEYLKNEFESKFDEYFKTHYAGKKVGCFYNSSDTYSSGIQAQFKANMQGVSLIEAAFSKISALNGAADNLPSKRLVINEAVLDARFTTLPTISEFTLAMKSSKDKSISTAEEFIFEAK